MPSHSLIKTRTYSTQKTMLILGIILIAFNLRPAITAVGPLVSLIRADMGLSNSAVGLITTLPLVAFAVFSPVAPQIARRVGNEQTLFLGLLFLVGGILIRSLDVPILLFVGTILVGLGIAICNVLLPALIKERFPQKVGLMTSVYSTAMVIFAALASGISIPLAQGLSLGWQGTLRFWVILAALAIVVWLPQLHQSKQLLKQQDVKSLRHGLLFSPLAWQVTFFMGLQSFCFYVTVAWLPEILCSYGLSISLAGWMLSLIQFISIPTTFIAPLLAERFPNQRKIIAVIGVLYLVGIGGLLVGRDIVLLTLSITLLGLGQGASVSLAFTLFVLRTENGQQAAELSGMAQSIGYLLAAI
ncbi:MAG: MFS transporter, partial [Bacilli bacterium]